MGTPLSAMTQDWDIQPRSEACGACRVAFTDRQPYFSSLIFGAQGYARQDFCATCWSGRADETASPHSAWQGVFRLPPPPTEEPLKKETAESLLRKLIEDQNPVRQDAMFILAVMLERKRIFVERDVQVQDGQTTRVYEHRQTGETFVIRDPHLDLNALSHVQQEVSELLGASRPAADKPATEAEAVAPAKPAGNDLEESDIPEPDELELEEEDAEVEEDGDDEVEAEEDEEEDEDEFDDDDDDDDDDEDEDEDEDDGEEDEDEESR